MYDAETPEEILASSLVMFVLLRKRFEMTDPSMREYGIQERQLELYEDKLTIRCDCPLQKKIYESSTR